MDGTTLLDTAALNGVAGSDQATLTVSNLTVGLHAITAVYNGDPLYARSTSSALSVQVKPAGTTTTLTIDPTTLTVGDTVNFSATVAPVAPGAGMPTGNVDFTISGPGGPIVQDVALVGSVASFTLTTLPAGNYEVTAQYLGDGNFLG